MGIQTFLRGTHTKYKPGKIKKKKTLQTPGFVHGWKFRGKRLGKSNIQLVLGRK